MSDPTTPAHVVGDVVNGHRLTETPTGLQWLPVTAENATETVPWYRRTLWGKPITAASLWWRIPVAVVVFFVLMGIIGSLNGRGDAEPAADSKPAAVATEEKPADAPKATSAPVPNVAGMTAAEATSALEAAGFTVAPGVDGTWLVTTTTPGIGGIADFATPVTLTATAPLTLAQQNAVREAQQYVDFMPFSRQGLIDQMTSEYGAGYAVEDATFAVDSLGVDWNAEAAEAAQSYLDTMAFSRDGLFDQLTSEYGGQFLPAEAEAGLAAVGY